MFDWFKKKNAENVVSENIVKTPDPTERFQEKIYQISDFSRSILSKIELSDKRFKVWFDEIDCIYFYVVNELGEQKRIAYHIYMFSSTTYYESGVWDNAFSKVLDEVIEKCNVLKKIENEKRESEQKRLDESFNKLFQEEI